MVGSRTEPFCPEALQYTSSLVQALGPLIAPAVPSLVEPMMSTGVSTPLMETLTSIAQVRFLAHLKRQFLHAAQISV